MKAARAISARALMVWPAGMAKTKALATAAATSAIAAKTRRAAAAEVRRPIRRGAPSMM
jgi:hypothetical protein